DKRCDGEYDPEQAHNAWTRLAMHIVSPLWPAWASAWCGKGSVLGGHHEPMDMGTAGRPCTRQPVKPVNTIALMATILRLPYTTAIRPSLRGGSLYGLPYLCPVSACTLLPL